MAACLFAPAQSRCPSAFEHQSASRHTLFPCMILSLAPILLFRWWVFFILMVLRKETQEKQVLEQFLWLKTVEWYNRYLMHLQICCLPLLCLTDFMSYVTLKISRLREGLGIVTNNVAEYRGLILGLKYAIRHGFRRIRVHGDSQLVCNQVCLSYL